MTQPMPHASDPIIVARELTRVFRTGSGAFRALDGVSLDVAAGEYVAIKGRSGAGKSTLLYQLSLLDSPDEGEVTIAGRPTSGLTEPERTQMRLAMLGYVFQEYALVPELTAIENVAIPSLMRGLMKAEAYAMSAAALDAVGLKGKEGNLPNQLSGGEQQRVSIARSIAHSPKIVFADEPTASLDSVTANLVMDIFRGLHGKGQTIVMVTHEDDYDAEFDRIIRLQDGRILGPDEG